MSTKRHVVSIDDEEHILTLIRAVLSDDFHVTTFNDTYKALETLPGLKPDIILCDITMPHHDGFEMHQALREIPHLRGVPFIYLTALGDRDNFRKGMNQGADDYLTKPFTPSELRDVVATRLERAEHLREEVLDIVSLGGASASYGGRILEYEAKKVLELLIYLIAKGKQVIWHDLFNDLWWKDVNDNAVHVLLGRARKALEGLAEFHIEGDALTLSLARPYKWDAYDFEIAGNAALKTKELLAIERSIQMYKGPFLKDFDSPWCNECREFYESIYVQLLEAAIQTSQDTLQRTMAQKRLDDFLESS